MNPREQRYLERLEELTEEGWHLARSAVRDECDSCPSIEDGAGLTAWKAKANNIVTLVFGGDGDYARVLAEAWKTGPLSWPGTVEAAVGVLRGAADDLRNGFLLGQEVRIAGEVFDSVLQEAKHLHTDGHTQAAAVLGRVVMEDALRRLSRQEALDDTAKATALNDALWKASRYGQPQWRLVQAWLDMGNAAAHGRSEEYTHEDVGRMLEDVGRFLANEFRA